MYAIPEIASFDKCGVTGKKPMARKCILILNPSNFEKGRKGRVIRINAYDKGMFLVLEQACFFDKGYFQTGKVSGKEA